MKKAITLILLAAAVVGFTGCNTVNGFGKDVERTGEKVQDAAKK